MLVYIFFNVLYKLKKICIQYKHWKKIFKTKNLLSPKYIMNGEIFLEQILATVNYIKILTKDY